MQQHSRGGRRAARQPSHAEVRELGSAALASELRQAGIAERGLGFALRTLGAELVLEELRRSERFGRRARRKATLATDRDERAAWTILAASGPRAIERRLERDGFVRRRLRRPPRVRSGARGGRGGPPGRRGRAGRSSFCTAWRASVASLRGARSRSSSPRSPSSSPRRPDGWPRSARGLAVRVPSSLLRRTPPFGRHPARRCWRRPPVRSRTYVPTRTDWMGVSAGMAHEGISCLHACVG
jgi:hypothetical protein